MIFKSQIDWMAEYNKYLEEKGESSKIGCLFLDMETKESRKQEFTHTETDGLSCVVNGLRENGFNVKDFPQVKFSKRPNLWQKILLGLRFVYNEVGPTTSLAWKYKKPDGPYRVLGPFPHYFLKEETSDLKKRARKYGVNIPTVLLYAMNKAVGEILLEKVDKSRWYIPFNMRGIYEGPSETSNHISNFVISLTPEDTPESIFKKKFKELMSGSVLVSFFFLNLGNFKPLSNMLRDKVKKDYHQPKVSERMMGSYAYLGEWPTADQHHLMPTMMIMPFGNVSLKNPICCSSLVWKGCLSFSLQLHSSILQNEDVGKKVLRRITEILKEI